MTKTTSNMVMHVIPLGRVCGRALLLWASLASSNQRDNMSDILCIRDTLGLCSPEVKKNSVS